MNKNLKVNLEAFVFFFKISPKYWVVFFLYRFIAVSNSFFDLFATAHLLNQFVNFIDLYRIVYLLTVILTVKFVMGITNKFLDYLNAIYSKEFTDKENLYFINKFVSIDYSEIEKTDFRQLRRAISESSNFGYGKHAFIQTIKDIIDDIFSLIISSYLFINFFISLLVNKVSVVSIVLFLTMFIFIALSIISNNYAINKTNEYFANKIDDFVDCNRIEDSINSYSQGKDIRLYKQSEFILRIKRQIFVSWNKVWVDVCKIRFNYSILPTILANLESIASNLLFIYFVFEGIILPGSFFSNKGYVEKFSNSISSICANISIFKNNTEHIERYISFCDYKEKSRDGFTFDNVHFNKVSFNNVSFKYPGCEETVLKNISINIKKGIKYAVVGQNGSGKSTFIKLLCRLYEPESGYIQIDDYKACEIKIDDYWNIFSVIFQDFNLFSFTLGQNISVCDNASEEQLLSIIEKVGFSNRYKDMEQGLDTLLYKNFDEKSVEISGGEAQKIALARAIYKDGEIFILDEPTAALDPIAESELYDNFNKIVQDKTVIYISHRLASCKFCDEIIVFDKGQIVQSGTHESLLKDKKGKYYELWTAQAKHYNT